LPHVATRWVHVLVSVFADEHLRGMDQAAGELAYIDRSAGGQRSHQAEVVLVWMANQRGIE
jgi:hypothetical protein